MSAFAFVRYVEAGSTRVGIVRDGLVTPLGQVLPDLSEDTDLHDLWARWDEFVHRIEAKSTPGGRALAQLTLLPAADPRQLFQAGANYRQHIIDLAVAQQANDPTVGPDERRARAEARVERRVREGRPYVFIGLPTSLSNGRDNIVLPDHGAEPDWEIELAVVLKSGGQHLSEVEAESAIGAYSIANDLTLRDLVYREDMPAIGTDWLRAKNPPGFTPLGPLLIPARFVPAPMSLRLTLRLNGDLMQDSGADDMLFGIPRLISYISETAMLLPGDVLLTGSPAGNGIHHGRLLRAGDEIEAEITGLGMQRTRFVGAPA